MRPYSSQFGGIFPTELHVVEARRRRYRIERTLGSLPMIAKLQDLAEAPDSGGSVVLPADLERKLQAVEVARDKLDFLRSPGVEMAANQPGTEGQTIQELALVYQTAAKELNELAQRHYLAGRSGEENVRRGAETYLRIATAEMLDAAGEVRRAAVSPPPPDSGDDSMKCMERFYGLIIQFEENVALSIDALCAKVVERQGLLETREDLVVKRDDLLHPKGQSQPVGRPDRIPQINDQLSSCNNEMIKVNEEIKASKKTIAQLNYQLARYEKRLFTAAARHHTELEIRQACQAAAGATNEEIQCRLRECNRPIEALPQQISTLSDTQPLLTKTSLPGNCSIDEAGKAAADGSANPTNECALAEGASDSCLALSRKIALEMDLAGLALSGGGIRSATFALGVLQGLAQLRLLGIFDYLSTVSGGGYIGAWLTAWIQREGSLVNVERQLSPNRLTEATAERVAPDGQTPLDNQPRDAEPEPVHHLRAYSRYLSPRNGLFSADTWTLFAITLRNLFVNSLFFLPLALALVFGWRLLLQGFVLPLQGTILERPITLTYQQINILQTILFGLAYILAVGAMAWQEENLFESNIDSKLRDGQADSPWATHFLFLLPAFLVALSAPWIFALDPYDAHQLRYFGESWRPEQLREAPPLGQFLQFVVSFLILSLLPSIGVRLFRLVKRLRILRNRRHLWWKAINLRGLAGSLILAVLFGAACYSILLFVIWPLTNPSSLPSTLSYAAALCLLHSLSVPLMFGAVVLSGWTEMAFLNRWFSEYEREWRSRVAAYLMIGATAWLVMAGTVYLVPVVSEIVSPWMQTNLGTFTPDLAKGLLTVAWAAISGAGAWLSSRGVADNKNHKQSWGVRALLTIAPIVFLIGLLTGVSMAGHRIASILQRIAEVKAIPLPGIEGSLAKAVDQPVGELILFAFSVVLFLLFGMLINVNRFSLHMLYANRLTRCYLGAACRKQRGGSRGTPTGVRRRQPRRQTNLFTGFDPWDDMPLADLRTIGLKATYPGPLPLINCALNCLAGDELAYQDRRADAFVMTPNWCGGPLTGFARTPRRDRETNNLTIGRVMTVSGAAVDPNMAGLSPPLTALMTLFNTRLGWWLENPNPKKRSPFRVHQHWAASEPGLGWPLFWEFIGRTNEKSDYVHVSDGGHFENLGVYELIRRRCRFVVVVDAGTDRVAASDNMAAMLRLVRTDFGINIELDPTPLQLDGDHDHSPWHCCIGRIRYDEVDEQGIPGLMVYLQATLTGDEPADLLQYASRHSDFPRQSTLNQFFDEAQFEAYRALGHHTAVQVFGEAAAAWTGLASTARQDRAEVRAVFACLRRQWFPPLKIPTTDWLPVVKTALEVEQHFTGNRNLKQFGHRVYPEVNGGILPAPNLPQHSLLEFHAVSQTLQVMQTVWAVMKLRNFHAHPGTRGWMNSFRRWTASPDFQQWWPILRAEYSRPFVSPDYS